MSERREIQHAAGDGAADGRDTGKKKWSRPRVIEGELSEAEGHFGSASDGGAYTTVS